MKKLIKDFDTSARCLVMIFGKQLVYYRLFRQLFFCFRKALFSPLSMIISLKEFTKYPLSLFNDGIVVLLTWIIPIAITSYYPTLLFLGDYSIIGYSASTSAFFRVRTNSVS